MHAAANLRMGDARTSVMLVIGDQLNKAGCLFSLPPQPVMSAAELDAIRPK